MPFFIPALITGASAIATALANRKSARTQTSNSTQNLTASETGSFSRTDTQSPVYDAETLGFRDQLINQYLGQLNEDPSNFIGQFVTSQIQNLNEGGQAEQRSIAENFARRGLGSSPAAAAAAAGADANRISAIVKARNQVPFMIQQLIQQRLDSAARFFSTIPKGQTNTSEGSTSSTRTGTTTGQQTTDPGGSVAGGLFAGLGSALAGLAGAGYFSGGGNVAAPGSLPLSAGLAGRNAGTQFEFARPTQLEGGSN